MFSFYALYFSRSKTHHFLFQTFIFQEGKIKILCFVLAFIFQDSKIIILVLCCIYHFVFCVSLYYSKSPFYVQFQPSFFKRANSHFYVLSYPLFFKIEKSGLCFTLDFIFQGNNFVRCDSLMFSFKVANLQDINLKFLGSNWVVNIDNPEQLVCLEVAF